MTRNTAALLTFAAALLVATDVWAQPGAPPARPPAGAPAAPAAPANPTMSTAPTRYVPPKEILGDDLEKWIRRLDSKDAAVRELAVRTVPLFGEPAKKALPKIIDLMGDRDYSVKLAAMLVATTNPIEDEKQQKEVISRLVGAEAGLIMSAQGSVRIQAAFAAGRLGPAAAGAIPALIGDYHLKNVLSYEARKAAAEALGYVAREDPAKPGTGPDRRAIIALLSALSDSSLSVRIEAAQSLLILGSPKEDKDVAAEKIKLLERTRDEPDKALVLWLYVCLMRLDVTLITAKNLDPFVNGLRSTDQHLRMSAAEAFGMMGGAARESNVKEFQPIRDRIAHLREGLKLDKSDKPQDLEFLAMCIWATGQMGKEASFMLPEVKALTQHPNEGIKAYAKDAVESIEGKKKP